MTSQLVYHKKMLKQDGSGESRKEDLALLLRNSIVYGLGEVLPKGISLILIPLYTRFLSPPDYGILSLVTDARGIRWLESNLQAQLFR
jgi:hypothetical protein